MHVYINSDSKQVGKVEGSEIVKGHSKQKAGNGLSSINDVSARGVLCREYGWSYFVFGTGV